MAGSLHGSARTTPRVRAELQASQETSGTLAQRYGLSRTTVAKWRTRTTTNDAPMGPGSPHSTVLTLAEEAMVIEFRRRTLLPFDDVLGCLREAVLHRPGGGRSCPRPRLWSGDADEDRASELQHAVERADGNVHLGRPTFVRA